MKFSPSVAAVARDTTQPADRLAWIAALVCMLGLVWTLAGSSRGADLFLLSAGIVVAARADRCLHLVMRAPILWSFPALAAVSTLWSVAPMVTLRAAAELALTIGIASLIAGLLRPREFVSAMLVSLLCGALLSLLFGRYDVDGMSGVIVFLGIFASKNTMAAFMSFLAIFSVAALADRGQPPLLRLVAAISLVLGVVLLLRAHSVGAVLTTAGALVVLPLTVVFARLAPRERLLALAGVAAIAVPAALLTTLLARDGALAADWSSFLTGDLGKDATLTGRTMLWQAALTEIPKHPFLGIGYYAFWVPGNLLAEALWRDFGVDGGFSFHDTYLEFAVELGWIGTAVLVLTLAMAIARPVALALADPSWANAALVAMVFCLVTRTIAEVDAPYPFAEGTFLLFAAAFYGAEYANAVRRTVRIAPVQPPPRALLVAEKPCSGA